MAWPLDDGDTPINPVLPEVLALLRAHPQGLSEHEIIKALETRTETFAELAQAYHLALFQKHFLVMNALYTLQEALLEEGVYLSVSPLLNRLDWLKDTAGARELTDTPVALRAYYLDWRHFADTTEADVLELLQGFWRRFEAGDRKREALAELDLPADASWAAVKQRYRSLAARHHPDRGGDSQRFMLVREAYEVLRPCWRQ